MCMWWCFDLFPMLASDILRESSPRRSNLPSLSGPVIRGFGRGSSRLGFPTANIPIAEHEETLKTLDCGIYFGYVRVDNSTLHHCVISIGWNPVYKNTQKSIEAHILHKFGRDFYGANLTLHLMGYVRQEFHFASESELIQAIRDDISYAQDKFAELESGAAV